MRVIVYGEVKERGIDPERRVYSAWRDARGAGSAFSQRGVLDGDDESAQNPG